MSRRGLFDILIWGFGRKTEILQDIHNHQHYEVPEQLAELVRQAHGTEPIRTMWGIQVSPEMRDALCAPLTAEQLAAIRKADVGVFSRSVSCHVVSYKLRGKELSGVVQVSVTVHSRYSKSERTYPPIKLRIVVVHNGRPFPNERWEVASVEQIA